MPMHHQHEEAAEQDEGVHQRPPLGASSLVEAHDGALRLRAEDDALEHEQQRDQPRRSASARRSRPPAARAAR